MKYYGEHWQKHGYGDWAVTDKAGGQLIGHCGLNFVREAGECDNITLGTANRSASKQP